MYNKDKHLLLYSADWELELLGIHPEDNKPWDEIEKEAVECFKANVDYDDSNGIQPDWKEVHEWLEEETEARWQSWIGGFPDNKELVWENEETGETGESTLLRFAVDKLKGNTNFCFYAEDDEFPFTQIFFDVRYEDKVESYVIKFI